MKHKNVHVGEQQMPLITPDSNWKVPADLPDLRGKVDCIAEDSETRDDGLSMGRGPGWAIGSGHICGVGWAWRAGAEIQKIYVPVRHPDTQCHDEDAVRRWIVDHKKSVRRWVYMNAPYDLGWQRVQWGIEPPQEIDDVSLQAFMIDENRQGYSLNDLCRWRGVQQKDESLLREAAAAYGWHGDQIKKNLYRLPARYVGPYGEGDPVSTLLLRDDMAPEIERQEMGAAYRLETELIPMFLEMRRRGIRVDVDGAERLRVELDRKRDEALVELGKRLGIRTPSIDDARSAKAVEQWFIRESVAYSKTEKTGQAQMESDWMRHHEHWLPRSVAVVRQLTETSEKFVQSYIQSFLHRGRLHATFNQWRTDDGGTRSHRISVADPPLQQAPSRPEDGWPLTGELALAFRRLFLAEVGEWWGAADYSQQEYRLIVHVASALGCTGADVAVDRYREDPNTDFHNFVVEITELSRRDAKDANFAKAFGAGVPKFASMIRKSVAEAGRIYETYDRELPFVRQCSQRCQKKADRTGFIRLLDGARSHFDLWEPAWREDGEKYYPPRSLNEARDTWGGARRLRRAYTHKAMNRKIQGDAARQTKAAMLECWRAGIVPLLQMHDELDFSVTSESVGEQIRGIMENAVKLRVPVKVDLEYGGTWGDAKHSWAKRGRAAR